VENSLVTLTAAVSPGSQFAGWTGAVNSSDLSIDVTMDEAKSVTATFNLLPGNFLLTVDKAGTGSGTVTSDPAGIACGDSCAAGFTEDTVVTLTAVADSGSTFAGWSGAVTSNSASIEVTMDAAKNITATFTEIQYALTISKVGGGGGLVTSDPAGIMCGATCTAEFAQGETVTLTAVPSVGSEFDGWTGAVNSNDLSIEVTMDEAKNVTAMFNVLPGNFLLTVDKSGSGTGTVASDPAGIACGDSCAAGFAENTVVTLTAVADSGSTFAGWSGAVTSNSASIEVMMDAAKNITATFNDDNVPPPDYTIFLPLISR
jgi:methyl-accepting chemotaxis protein